MSAREWKPGDVAKVEGRICIRNGEMWEHGDPRQFAFPGDAEARPLVVIDPEDAEQVERLLSLWANQEAPVYGRRSLVAALREFANPAPPKPDEPMGKYAVVEDTDGVEWVRIDPAGFGWQRLGDPSTEHNAYASWDGFDAVRVLSEGVPS